MPANRSSSDSSGGGALLHAKALDATPQREDLYSTKSSDSPTDDEMALVQASNKFNQLVNDANSYRPAVAADEYHQGHHLRQSSTTRSTAIVGQSIFTPGVTNSVPPNIASSPLYRGFGDIQARLVTAQQYVRITPGFNNDQAQTIQSLLVGVGQDLTHFATTVIQEHTKSQHQAGELRLQYEKAQNELFSRRQQISELQEQYKDLVQEKELEKKTIASLERQIESHQNEVKQLQKLSRDYDQKHMKQVQVLEDEIKSLRMSQGSAMQLQLANVSNTPKTNNPLDGDSDSDDDDFLNKFKTPTSRRKSALNPAAPEFGPRGTKTDHSKEMLPLLRKYANEGVMKTAGRLMETQDARAYEGNSFEPPKRTATRMDFRGSPGFANGHSNAFGTKSNALMPSGAQSQSRYKSIADFANIDFSKLQIKDSWEAEDITLGFVRLFGMIEGLIAKHHVNAPFNENDNMLSFSHPATWNYILSMGLKNQTQSASHMMDLLTKFDCRHWVLKRILVDYIVNRLIVPEVFFGFSNSTDHHLTALQGRMKTRGPGQTGRPQGLERQRIVTDHAKVIQFIVESPGAQEFKQRTVAKHVDMLHDILKPMRSCFVEDGQARKALTVVVNAAWTITTKVWSSGMTLHFYFPETGSKFAYGTMRSLNYTETRSDQMQYQQYRIMLVVTPTLSLRDDRDVDRLRTHELLKSDVLVMR